MKHYVILTFFIRDKKPASLLVSIKAVCKILISVPVTPERILLEIFAFQLVQFFILD